MSAYNSSCHSFSDKELNSIFYTRIGVTIVSFVACFVALILISVLMCYMKVWKTLVHRLKLYLTAVALVISPLYLLQTIPMKYPNVDWASACKAIGILQLYVNWVMLLLICWMIVYLLRLAQRIGKPRKFGNSPNSKCSEGAGIVFTLSFPLLFVWTPFVTNSYGLGYVWCGIVVKHSRTCNDTAIPTRGLGYLIGLWYGPAFIVVLLCTVGLVFVISKFVVYYKKRGLTQQINSAIVKGIPPAVYLVLYNAINCVDITSLTYHNIRHSERRDVIDYRLWMTHAVTGPSRALAVPFAFVLSQLLIQCCFKKRKATTYVRIP